MSPIVKALGLLSGGLDSLLAVCVLRAQGLELAGISFETPFFDADRGRSAAEKLGIPVMVKDITVPHLKMLKNPKHGFGSNMNPCIDCHILMVNVACKLMKEGGFDFIFTGEVLNERPMSQNKQALRIVEKESGCEGYLLRPLSAKLLDETVPEKEGKVRRERLLGISGRSRKPQIELAKRYGLKEYPTPAGGCLLTDPSFSKRLRELRERDGLDDVRSIQLLKIGRHFRLGSGRKVIVGRNESENRRLEEISVGSDTLLRPRGVPGPIAMLPGGGDGEEQMHALRLCARYSDAEAGQTVRISILSGMDESAREVACPRKEEIEWEAI
jgi:tRNA-specific 2-thiouridylase